GKPRTPCTATAWVNGPTPSFKKVDSPHTNGSTTLLQHTSLHLGDGSSTRQVDLQSSLLLNNRNNLDYSESANINERYTCGYCSKVFTKRGTLTIHLRIHTGFIDVPLRLEPSPQQVLNERRNLQHHPVCSDTTTSLTSKRKGKRLHKCIYCSKVFKRKSILDKHLPIHTGEKPFYCHLCPMKFTRKDGLVRHVRVHTGEKPFHCRFCPKACADESNLKRHEATHTRRAPRDVSPSALLHSCTSAA
ncbi:uncharacterized protein, partial [Dermacentor andersoni]|uniref:uncharacterized protein n=1 Tax=Dermacentor andersoni TaxID=34620 RepID=UPI002417E2E2